MDYILERTAEGNGEVNKTAWGKENYAYVKQRAGVTEVVPGDQCITVLGAPGRSRLETIYKPVTQAALWNTFVQNSRGRGTCVGEI